MAEPIRVSLTKHLEVACLSSITRGGDAHTLKLLRECRDELAHRREGDFVEQKLAFLLGWRGHNAADRHFKPIYRLVEPEAYENAGAEDPDVFRPSDVRIYHDVVIFREVYDCGRSGRFPTALLDYRLESHPGFQAVNVEQVSDLLSGLWLRSLLEVQSFVRTEENLDVWIKRTLDRYLPFGVDIVRYADAYFRPDNDKMRRFIVDNNFYDRTDPLIVLARSIQHGKPDRTIDLDKAVEAAATQSQYAQTIRKGYLYLVATSEYLEGRIDEEELGRLFDLDKPHV